MAFFGVVDMIKIKIYYILLSAFVILYGMYIVYLSNNLIEFIHLLPFGIAMYILNELQLMIQNKKGDKNE